MAFSGTTTEKSEINYWLIV